MKSDKNISSEQRVIYRHKFQKDHKKQVCLDVALNNDNVLCSFNTFQLVLCGFFMVIFNFHTLLLQALTSQAPSAAVSRSRSSASSFEAIYRQVNHGHLQFKKKKTPLSKSFHDGVVSVVTRINPDCSHRTNSLAMKFLLPLPSSSEL